MTKADANTLTEIIIAARLASVEENISLKSSITNNLFDYKIERTYAGYWQRCTGAWSWFVVIGVCSIGSQWTFRDCMKSWREERATLGLQLRLRRGDLGK